MAGQEAERKGLNCFLAKSGQLKREGDSGGMAGRGATLEPGLFARLPVAN